MGTLVWTIPSALKFQLYRVDVFGNNSASRNFIERHTDYCNGVGAVSLDFGAPVFNAAGFSQHLDYYYATLNVKAAGLESQIFTWAEGEIMSVTIRDDRKLRSPALSKAFTPLPRNSGKAISIVLPR